MASSSQEAFNHDILLDQLCRITGFDRATGERIMNSCSWNLEKAVNIYLDKDCALNGNKFTYGNDHAPSPILLKRAMVEIGVPPPVPPKKVMLIKNDFAGIFKKPRPHFICDGLRHDQIQANWQKEELKSESLDPDFAKRLKTLENLFRPPTDLIYKKSFESARKYGSVYNKWLVVNIQNSKEFACHVLNRDIWSNQVVKSIISENFVFWQVYCDSAEGQRYMQSYKPVEFPYIAIIDPRTGKKIATWNKVDLFSFCEAITSFLSEHSFNDGLMRSSKSDGANIVNTKKIREHIEALLKKAHISDNGDEDVDSGGEDVDSGGEDVVSGGEDIVSGGEDIVSGGEDVVSGAEDVVSGAEDVSGGEDVVSEGEDVVGEGEDVSGGEDVVSEGEDVVGEGEDVDSGGKDNDCQDEDKQRL